MTNAELAAHFASLPPNEPATIHLLNADTANMTAEAIDAANEHMLSQVESEFFIDPKDLPEDRDLTEDEETALLTENRKKWVGKPVIFQKW